MKRWWYEEEPTHDKNIIVQKPDAVQEEIISRQEGPRKVYNHHHHSQHSKRPTNYTLPFSGFDSRFGRHADPLYSKHETTPRISGVDLSDSDYVFVDPHVLATPILSDVDGDGIYAELVVPVSYYYDPHHYGDARDISDLNGLVVDDLINYVGGGIVVVDLKSGKIIGQRLLGITRAIDDQPGYILATPTVVRLKEGDSPVIIIGSAMGKLHVLDGRSLQDITKFPLYMDSLTAQVAVGDIFGNGKLDLVVGDYSGNVYCVDGEGVRVWERELGDGEGVSATVRLVDLDGDGSVEVVLVTRNGGVWVLKGHTGEDHSPDIFPLHLKTGVESPVLAMHMMRGARRHQRGKGESNDTVALLVGTANGIYVIDSRDGCINHIPSHVIHEILSGDIDPYNPGLELVSVGLDGMLACFKTTVTDRLVEKEAWSMEATGPSFFTHKDSSFYFIVNSSREVTGRSFDLKLTIFTNHFEAENLFNVSVSIGMKYYLYHEITSVQRRRTELTLHLATPPMPLLAFLTVRVCTLHQQCRTKYVHVRFNLHFADHLRWFLCVPFLSLCAVVLWVHRGDADFFFLPTSLTSSSSKKTSGTRKDC